MASTYLSRATSDPQSSNTTATFSVWLKRSGLGSDQTFWGGSYYSTDNMFILKFSSADKLQVYSKRGASVKASLKTTRLLRDTNAWYHIVIAIDTTQASAADRIKVYINGVQETSFSTNTQPSQDENLYLDSGAGANYYIGQRGGNAEYFDGLMSHFHYVDGSQLAPTVFGETDATTGEWKIKTSPSYTVGTKGFFVLKDGNSGTDQSANSNNFTVGGGTLTKTEDCPSNFFCTMNPLMSFAGASDGIDAFSEGNTVVDSNNDTSAAGSTFGVQNGKWYYEAKLTTGDQSSTNFSTGWASVNYEAQKGTGNGVGFMTGEDNASMDPGGNIIWNNSGNGNQATFGNRSTNDIFQVALDLDNHKMWFGINGTWSNGSASQSTTFNASSPDFSSIFDTAGVDYMPAFAQGSSGRTVLAYNFGNPSYSISTGHSDDNGYGNFEYEVPSGFYSLCTKNLAEFG